MEEYTFCAIGRKKGSPRHIIATAKQLANFLESSPKKAVLELHYLNAKGSDKTRLETIEIRRKNG
jgi:hypothetical protein